MNMEDRIAIVTQMTVNQEGLIEEHRIFPAWVRNHAQLAYPSVGSCWEGQGPIPEKIHSTQGLEQALRLQHEIAQTLKRSAMKWVL